MNWKELIEFLMTNKIIKPIIVAVVIVLAIGVIFFVGLLIYKGSHGEHIKAFGFEINDAPQNKQPTIKASTPKNKTPDSLVKTLTQSNKNGDNILSDNVNKGKNNFNGGKYNKYTGSIQVGDVNEKELTAKEANNILNKINSIRQKDTTIGKTISYSITDDSNLRKFTYELEKFLEKKSFIIMGPNEWNGSIDGINITAESGFYKDRKIIDILIGTSLTKGDVHIH